MFHTEKGYPRVSLEAASVRSVELILMADYFEKKGDERRAAEAWRKFFPTKNAVAEILDPNTTARPGPRLVTGVEEICRIMSDFKQRDAQ